MTALTLPIPFIPTTQIQPQTQPNAAANGQVSSLLAQAVRDGWNYETDWLWLAAQVADERERRYCFEYALYINPESEAAREALAGLNGDDGVGFWRRLGF